MKETQLKTFIGVMAAFAVALAFCWVYWYGFDYEPRFVVWTLILAGFILLGEVFSLRLNEQVTMGTWDIGLILAVAMLGPNWAAIAALPAALFAGKQDWLRTVHEITRNVATAYLAGITFSLVSEPLQGSTSQPLAVVFYGTLMSGMTLLVANELINGALVKVKYNQDFHETWKDIWGPYLLSDTINVFTAGLGVLALLVYGPLAAIVVVGGSIGSQFLVYRSREQVQKIQELQSRVRSLEESLTSSNVAFGTMIIREMGQRDGYTDRHAAATAVFAEDLAREMKLGELRVRQVRLAGLIHNVGLFGLPDELLVETGKLNSIGRSKLAEHPERGERTLAAVPEFKEMARWVRWHHERPDGRGYPDRLRRAWIPLEAKVLAVSQAYAAMVLDQPRRPGLGFAEARTKLIAGSGTEFDEVVVRAFLRILDTETDGYRMADDDRFIFPSSATSPAPPVRPAEAPVKSL